MNLRGHRDGEAALERRVGRAREHVRRRRGGRLLAEFDRLGRAVREADDREGAAADAAGVRVEDAQAERGGDGGVHCVASFA